jgi:hypothetical protein
VEREGTVLAANLGAQECEIKLPAADSWTIELASKSGTAVQGDSLLLPPYSIALSMIGAVSARRRRRAVSRSEVGTSPRRARQRVGR